ncbi:MAG: hypothetical protein ACREJC_13540 [Tepidisphaeraceae bacterium]
MNLRRLFLKLMLWSLGIGAVVGAASILLVPFNTVWRVVATCFITATAALLLLGCSLLSDKPRTREAGLLGMAAVIGEYFASMILVWNSYGFFGGGSFDDHVALSMFLLAPVAVVAMAALGATNVPLTRVAGVVGVGSCAIESVLLMVAIWGPWQYSVSNRWYGTSAAFAVFAPVAIASLVGAGTDRRWWRWIGTLAAGAALAAALVGIWKTTHQGPELFTILTSVATFVAYANVICAMPLGEGQNWLRVATLASAALTAVCVDVAIIAEQDESGVAARLGGACGIIAGCGTLALLVVARLNRRVDTSPEAIAELTEMTVICPVCRKKHSATTGRSQCPSCGLIMHIRLEEPRCPKCEYVLLMLKSDRCPECGTAIVRSSEARDSGS